MNAAPDQSDSPASRPARPRRRIFGASPAFWIIVLLAFAAAAATIQYFNYSAPGCNGIRQARIMRAAERDAERIMPELQRNPLFQNVRLGSYTAGTCGCMKARGSVANEVVALELRSALEAYQLPYEVDFYLEYTDDGSYFDPARVPDIPIFTPDKPQ